MSKITTHILDTTKGRPACGVRVLLYKVEAAGEIEIANARTNHDGRIADWMDAEGGAAVQIVTEEGMYKIRFETREYFEGIPSFYPFVDIYFEITVEGHYHVPLLISPFGYSTYRGS